MLRKPQQALQPSQQEMLQVQTLKQRILIIAIERSSQAQSRSQVVGQLKSFFQKLEVLVLVLVVMILLIVLLPTQTELKRLTQ